MKPKLQPHNDWVLVRVDPLPEKIGTLFIPSKGNVYTAEVVAVGPGKVNTTTGARIPLAVKVGEVITFFRWNLEHQQGKQLRDVLEDVGADLGLIKEQDILFVVPVGEKVVVS